MRKDSLKILSYALDAVDPKQAVFNKIRVDKDNLFVDGLCYSLKDIDHLFVIGGGKAVRKMAIAVDQVLKNHITEGIINIPTGIKINKIGNIILNSASHPIPDQSGIYGVESMFNLVKKASDRDLVICLISGGGSSLMTCPAEGLTLNDIQSVTSLLLKFGATINDLNAVRKHIDAFKGGQLALKCGQANVLSLILSDVVGDKLEVIASGPTVPDTSSYADAVQVLKKFRAWELVSESVRARLLKGSKGELPETPKPGNPIFNKVHNVVIANNSKAAVAAIKKAEELGYATLLLSTMVEGEAKNVGGFYASIAKEVYTHTGSMEFPLAVVGGGETTVNVKSSGKGGRNQELVLGAAKKIREIPAVIVALGTDGIDGPTDAAGGIVDGSTWEKVMSSGHNIEVTLQENDSYHLLSMLGDTLKTGVTGTNVNDLHLVLIAGGNI